VRELARPCIKDIQPYEPGKPIEELQRELGLEDIVKIASNENPLGPSPKAVKAIMKIADQLNRYPDGGCFYLKKRLARFLNVEPSSIIIGNGSNEIIEFVARAYLNEGEEVVIADPTFLIYKIVVAVQGGKAVSVPLKSFTYDLAAMKKAITPQTKIVFIANPNNPTGTSVGKDALEEFLNNVPANLIVVVDEAYNEFVERPDFPNSLTYLDNANLIVLRTFSKAHGLSGLRIGYGVARRELIDYMEKIRQPFNVNALAQAAALASIEDTAFIANVRQFVLKEKRWLYARFDDMGIRYIKSDTNFILADVKKSGREVFEAMLRQGVIVRAMDAYGLANYIRITVGTSAENKKCIKALTRVLGG
jgi:histidinol-phosphate aminotransferase